MISRITTKQNIHLHLYVNESLIIISSLYSMYPLINYFLLILLVEIHVLGPGFLQQIKALLDALKVPCTTSGCIYQSAHNTLYTHYVNFCDCLTNIILLH
jgi:hypothetical protein